MQESIMRHTRNLAQKRGWCYMQGAKTEQYFFRNPNSDSCQIFMSAANPEQLIFRIVPRAGRFAKVKSRVEAARQKIFETLEVSSELMVTNISEKTGKPLILRPRCAVLSRRVGFPERQCQSWRSITSRFCWPWRTKAPPAS